MAKRNGSAILARRIARAEAEELPFEPAARVAHIHEECGGMGCRVCDNVGVWPVAVGKDAFLPRPKGEIPHWMSDQSSAAAQEGSIERQTLRPRMD